MIDVSILISVIAVLITGIGTFANLKKGSKSESKAAAAESKAAAAETATIIVKLENIGNDTKEIKNELQNVRSEVGDLRDRVIIAEQATKSLHRRVDTIESRFCNADK